MAEPTIPTATAWAITAGLMASFLAAIGVTWVHVFWAAAGAFVGSGFAPPAGRWRAMLMFPVSTMLAAKAGIVAAAWWGSIGAMTIAETAQSFGGLVGIVFHPLTVAVVNLVGSAFHPLTAAVVNLVPAVVRHRLGLPPENLK